MTVYKILFVLTIALEFVFVPWFLKAMWPKKNKKSLALKMVCATLFVSTGLLAITISGNTSEFARLVLAGLFFGWLGDFFLHVNEKKLSFLIGLLSFLGGHMFYIAAYFSATREYFADIPLLVPAEIAAFIVIFGAGVAFAVVRKMRMGPATVPIALYAATITLMLVKASSLGFRLLADGSVEYAGLICTMLVLGALQFLISDVLLAVLLFDGQKKNYKMKIVNIVTYFSAQLLLASTILFVPGF